MKTNFSDVAAFHEKFGLTYDGPPRWLPTELEGFRVHFLQEELDEYVQALANGSMAKAFDALLDLVYVAMGTAYLHGFPWELGWDAVQSANMAKERARVASDSKRGTTFDVVKPPGWLPPDIERTLQVAALRFQQPHAYKATHGDQCWCGKGRYNAVHAVTEAPA